MIRFLIAALVWLASAAVGLLAAEWLLDDVNFTAAGFATDVLIFAAAQSILTPFVAMMARKYAAPLLGGIGLVTTVIALILTSTFTDGLTITGLDTWVFASLIVWVVSMAATLLLPLIIGKRALARRKAGRQNPGSGAPANA